MLLIAAMNEGHSRLERDNAYWDDANLDGGQQGSAKVEAFEPITCSNEQIDARERKERDVSHLYSRFLGGQEREEQAVRVGVSVVAALLPCQSVSRLRYVPQVVGRGVD